MTENPSNRFNDISDTVECSGLPGFAVCWFSTTWSERFSLRRTAQLQPTAALDCANRRAELLVAPKLATQTLQVLYRNEISIISIKDGSGAVTITPPFSHSGSEIVSLRLRLTLYPIVKVIL